MSARCDLCSNKLNHEMSGAIITCGAWEASPKEEDMDFTYAGSEHHLCFDCSKKLDNWLLERIKEGQK